MQARVSRLTCPCTVCACRYAIRENIEKDIERERVKAENPDSMEEDAPDPVPSITRAHFEEAMKYARRSVSDADIRKYQARTASPHQFYGQGMFLWVYRVRGMSSFSTDCSGPTFAHSPQQLQMYGSH